MHSSRTYKPILCAECGVEAVPAAPTQKRCAECGAVRRAAVAAAGAKRRRDAGYRSPTIRNTRAEHLWRKYGLTEAEYDVMFESQNGLCAISCCTREIKAVDHDHHTGVVRALLCLKHNVAMHEDFTTADFLAMADYLFAHSYVTSHA